MSERRLDVICLGRSSVDLYGEQVGGLLEDMQSFAKYVGGCATNIAIGTARLGLKSGLITRVGDEQMGRFIRHTLAAEGVDISHVSTDPERLTALVILGIRARETFPHVFYRDNCADMAIGPQHIDPDFIGSATALLVTGTHFSAPGVEAASRAAIGHARAAGTKVIFDIDYRPVLWGLTGHGAGESRFVESADVTTHLQSILPDWRQDAGCDRGQARARGLHRLPGRDPRAARPGPGRPRLSGRDIQHHWRRRRLHEWLPARLAARRVLGDLLPLRQCRRRARGVAPRLLARLTELAGTGRAYRQW
jgi:hypothetical protein